MNPSDNRSGPPRPDQRYSGAAPTAPPPEPPPPPPAPSKLIEVELVKKYCPHWLVMPDGNFSPNVAMPLEMLPPGVVSLHPDDAGLVLEKGVAHATRNTFKDMK